MAAGGDKAFFNASARMSSDDYEPKEPAAKRCKHTVSDITGAAPAAKTTNKSAAKTTAAPAAKPTAAPAAKPTAKPAAKPTAKPAAKPTAKPAAKPTANDLANHFVFTCSYF